ncbi:MAG: hypothetical protein JWL81_1646 [Verrucomicrobiales bacterium]|nr:hypothetical protein [Verrucomicrobiales bacterium]
MASLSHRVFQLVGQDYFRPLTRPSAPVYVDCADRLVEEAGDAARLPYGEALAVIREVIGQHPGIVLSEDEGAALRDVRQKAGAFFNRMLAAGWLEEQTLGLQDRWAVISPGLRPLLRLLKQLAEDDAAELRTFADALKSVCDTLGREGILDAAQTGDELRSTVTDLNQRLEHAIEQLHSVEKLVGIFEQRQRASNSPAETLQVFYGEFGQGQHMVCYDALRRGGLLPRIQAARTRVAEARDDVMVKQRLAEGFAEHYRCEETEAWQMAATALLKLERALGGLRQRAEAIDARMAAFNRLSQQRYRYQTELRGRRPEVVRNFCEAINDLHAGRRFRDLAEEAPLFVPRAPEVKFHYGVEALWKKRKPRAATDLTFTTGRGSEADAGAVLESWQEKQRLALTPQRAARLLQRLMPPGADKIRTDGFVLTELDELLDLLALAAYDHAPAAGGRSVRWTITGPRRIDGLHPDNLPRDPQAGWSIDRMEIQQTR